MNSLETRVSYILEPGNQPDYLVTLTQVLTPFCVIVSCYGNISLLIATKTKKVAKVWRQPISILIINNSICNLILTFITFITYLVVLTTKKWLLPASSWCSITKILKHCSVSVSFLSLTAVAIIQLGVILRTIKQKKMKATMSRKLIATIWIISCSMAICIVTIKNQDTEFQSGPGCTYGLVRLPDKAHERWNIVFSTTLFLNLYSITNAGIIVLYTVLAIKLRKRKEQEIWKLNYSILYAKRIKEKRRVVRTFLYISLLFLVTWSPARIQQLLLLENVETRLPVESIQIINYIVTIIAFSHVCLSPFIFAVLVQKYREYYMKQWKQIKMLLFGNDDGSVTSGPSNNRTPRQSKSSL